VEATFGPVLDRTRLPAGSSLAGLIKWLGRDGWREPFEEVLWLHVGPACEQAGIGFGDIEGILGHRTGRGAGRQTAAPLGEPGHEAPERRAERLGVKLAEQAAERVVARHAVGECQDAAQARAKRCERNTSLDFANSAMSTAPCPPHGTEHSAMNKSSWKSCRPALPVRGSSNSSQHAANRSKAPPPCPPRAQRGRNHQHRTQQASDTSTPFQVRSPWSLPPFGLTDRLSGSVALWQEGEIVSHGDRTAAIRLARAYARWAAFGLPGTGAFRLEVHRAGAAPSGTDRLWIEPRGATALAWRLRPDIGNWQALAGADAADHR